MTGWREEDSAVCLKISSFLRYYLRVPRQLMSMILPGKYLDLVARIFQRKQSVASTCPEIWLSPLFRTLSRWTSARKTLVLGFSVCFFFNVQDHRIWDNELHFVIFINIRIAWISYLSFLLLRRGGRDVLYIHKRYNSYKLSRAGVSLRLLTL